LIFFNIAGEFLVNTAGFVIPGYYSLNALFSASKVDDSQVRLSSRSASAVADFCITKYANLTTVVDGMLPGSFYMT
jgi:hypothetical protein